METVNFDKAFGLTRELYFSDHRGYYSSVVRGLGYEDVKKCIPFTLEQIKNALAKGDEHLNTLPIKKWDNASGIVCTDYRSYWISTPLTNLYKRNGINCASQAEGVCILKECAKMWAEESEVA